MEKSRQVWDVFEVEQIALGGGFKVGEGENG